MHMMLLYEVWGYREQGKKKWLGKRSKGKNKINGVNQEKWKSGESKKKTHTLRHGKKDMEMKREVKKWEKSGNETKRERNLIKMANKISHLKNSPWKQKLCNIIL